MIATTYRPKRRFVRFSLRAFLLAMLLVCVALGSKVEQARKQREVVTWVQEMGGSVSYDHEIGDDSNRLSNVELPAPKWLIELLGIDFFDGAVSVELVRATQVSDVAPLAGLTNLRVFGLEGTQVTDVTPLARLTSLETLILSGIPMSDVSLLADLTSLKALYLSRTSVRDVSPLTSLISLQSLRLDNTEVSDLTPLSELTSLKTLYLSKTQVSDVTPLAELTNLKRLSLGGTRISEVMPLAGLTKLKKLGLVGTSVSSEDMDNLRRALPQCNISHIHLYETN